MFSRLFAICFFCLIVYNVFGQSVQSDSSVLAQAVSYTRAQYQHKLADNARIYNGAAYPESILREYDKGHPYFSSLDWQRGFIDYDGQRYENIELLYDVVKQKVVTHQYFTLIKIELVEDLVSAFGIGGHTFIHVNSGDSLSRALQPGYYDQLETGTVSLYAKRTKQVVEDLSSNRVVREFRNKDYFYLVKKGRAFPIKTKKDLFNTLDDKREPIKDALSAKKIRFRKNTEAALILAVQQYNKR